ncbi:hypothetical protein PIB30_038948 [Stylosanthes scabra]|uniref:CCHC-type domain-containing protein n=1 Tax=Stylosanthes scabra TaxID=79078 RepID=A0ABU6UCW0_9FABA|nr:hypothetical protein [Stylosanthes scabra]
MDSIHATYRFHINLVPSEEYWTTTNYLKIDSPFIKRPIGRPKVHARQRDPVEVLIESDKLKKTFRVTCSKCGEKGHNYKTCKVGGLYVFVIFVIYVYDATKVEGGVDSQPQDSGTTNLNELTRIHTTYHEERAPENNRFGLFEVFERYKMVYTPHLHLGAAPSFSMPTAKNPWVEPEDLSLLTPLPLRREPEDTPSFSMFKTVCTGQLGVSSYSLNGSPIAKVRDYDLNRKTVILMRE